MVKNGLFARGARVQIERSAAQTGKIRRHDCPDPGLSKGRILEEHELATPLAQTGLRVGRTDGSGVMPRSRS